MKIFHIWGMSPQNEASDLNELAKDLQKKLK